MRIAQIALVCEADKRGRTGLEDVPYPQGAALQQALAAAMTVRAEDVARGLSGPEVGEAIRRARIRAVAEATGKKP